MLNLLGQNAVRLREVSVIVFSGIQFQVRGLFKLSDWTTIQSLVATYGECILSRLEGWHKSDIVCIQSVWQERLLMYTNECPRSLLQDEDVALWVSN